MVGRYCRVEALDLDRHASDLHDANLAARSNRNWTYLPADSFSDYEAYRAWLLEVSAIKDSLFHAIVDEANGRAAGIAAYLRIDPDTGVIEVGHLNL